MGDATPTVIRLVTRILVVHFKTVYIVLNYVYLGTVLYLEDSRGRLS